MSGFYYVDSHNQKRGPFSIEQIKNLARNGVIRRETILVSESGGRRPAGSVPGGLPFKESTSSPGTSSSSGSQQNRGGAPGAGQARPGSPTSGQSRPGFPAPGAGQARPGSPTSGSGLPGTGARPTPTGFPNHFSGPATSSNDYSMNPPGNNSWGHGGSQGNSGFGRQENYEYLVVPGPKEILVGEGQTDMVFSSYAEIINEQTLQGWIFHSVEDMTIVEDYGCLGALLELIGCFFPNVLLGTRKNSKVYYMVIFERPR